MTLAQEHFDDHTLHEHQVNSTTLWSESFCCYTLKVSVLHTSVSFCIFHSLLRIAWQFKIGVHRCLYTLNASQQR